MEQGAASAMNKLPYMALTAHSIRTLCVQWVAQNFRPISIVRDSAFNLLMALGRPNVSIPSPTTVQRDLMDIYEKIKSQVTDELNVS